MKKYKINDIGKINNIYDNMKYYLKDYYYSTCKSSAEKTINVINKIINNNEGSFYNEI